MESPKAALPFGFLVFETVLCQLFMVPFPYRHDPNPILISLPWASPLNIAAATKALIYSTSLCLQL